MNSKTMVLLKTLLKSTSLMNKVKYSHDSKMKNKAVGGVVAFILVYALIMVYAILMCIGYGYVGLTDSIPAMCALTISAIAIFFTFFKTNGYLFNFKEYDMLMSLPFEPKTIAATKFLYMYINSLSWYLSISLSMMIAYGIMKRPAVYVYLIWIVLSFFIPIIPMLIAAFLGFVVAKISSGIRFGGGRIIQTVLTFAFVILCFSLQFIIQSIFSNDALAETLSTVSDTINKVGSIYRPIVWFANGVVNHSIIDIVLLILVTIVLFEILFKLVGANYRQINSAMKSHSASRSYKMTEQKTKSVVVSIAYKEYKRFTGSTTYLVNAGLGEILTAIIGILSLVVGFEKLISIITKGAPLSNEMLWPAIPFIIYFLIGMVSTTTCSPSLEGKNYWIIQSLPISKKTLYQGKMLFNMCLAVPFALFGVLCMSISAKAPVLNCVLYLILIIILCGFSTVYGCLCGIKHMKLDWENEIEVVKQGTAVLVYMLPNMLADIVLVVAVVILGTKINGNIITIALAVIIAILTFIIYKLVMKKAEE